MDRGTLHQLCNLINRKNLPSKPKQNLNACEDFIEVVGIGRVIAAAKELLENESFDPSDVTPEQKMMFARKIVGKYVNLHLVGEESLETSDSVLLKYLLFRCSMLSFTMQSGRLMVFESFAAVSSC